jgi:FixJ family two-component response regulator
LLLLYVTDHNGNKQVSTPNGIVFVIDDDESVRKSLKRLLRSANYQTEVFESASDFLARSPYFGSACIVVDVKMPRVNGIEFQQALIDRRREEQLIFITGHGNIPMCAQVMKAGAVDFLPKPFKPRELLKCVERALARSIEQRRGAAEKDGARRLLDLLTPREFEVMELVVTGMLNKQVGGELGMAEKTVKVHRGRMMQKLGINCVPELVRLVQKAGISLSEGNGTKV